MSYGFFSGPVLENHMVLEERVWGYEIEDEPEPEPTCACCGFEPEIEIDGEPLCIECVANNLVPD